MYGSLESGLYLLLMETSTTLYGVTAAELIQKLKDEYNDSQSVWFFVNVNYRILAYNKKAAHNASIFHKKQIAVGQSILDYARDTKNQIDGSFIECFGKAATGEKVESEQQVKYDSATLCIRSTYTPLFRGEELLGISIIVDDTADSD
jgi:hypothetical protein